MKKALLRRPHRRLFLRLCIVHYLKIFFIVLLFAMGIKGSLFIAKKLEIIYINTNHPWLFYIGWGFVLFIILEIVSIISTNPDITWSDFYPGLRNTGDYVTKKPFLDKDDERNVVND